jgi:hypothetical protein
VSDEAAIILTVLALVLGGVVWWIKDNFGTFIVLVVLVGRILFVLAVIVIGIYCLTRLL